MIINLKTKANLSSIPKKPGVYFWRDKKGTVLYVGRATSLNSRLHQYFQKNIDSRIAEMVNSASSISFTVTDSLLEAIILEAQNIKKYWPKYNVRDRDDRSFIYIVIPKGDYPRPLIVRGQDLKKFPAGKSAVFGPYQSYSLVQNALRIVRRIFPYSTCRPLNGQPCFDYQIGLCPGACIGVLTPAAYKKNITSLSMLLKGQRRQLLTRLAKQNPAQARALEHLQEVSLLSREKNLDEPVLNRLEGYDISHLAGKESYGSMVVFSNGEIDKKEYRLFKIKTAPAGDDERSLFEVLERRFQHPEWPRPDLIMIDGGRPQIEFVSKFFAKANIAIPIVGISKYGGDELVFSSQIKGGLREIIKSLKPTLLKLREEAHRFGVSAGRRARSSGFKF